MEKPNAFPTNPATPERLVRELNTLRDAATSLSLALADYHFLVAFVEQTDATKEVSEILATAKSVALK